jgi:hypothetical protein
MWHPYFTKPTGFVKQSRKPPLRQTTPGRLNASKPLQASGEYGLILPATRIAFSLTSRARFSSNVHEAML